MRVIGGVARGRRLQGPPSPAVRPTSDRVREAVFDVLGSLRAVAGAEVLDLFAGTGALGIEALSRGAASSTFVESDPGAVRVLEANLAGTGLAGAGAQVVREDALRFLSGTTRRFDLALVDPPYRFERWGELLGALQAELAVLESSRPVALPARFRRYRAYRYGTTLVTVACASRRAGEAEQVVVQAEESEAARQEAGGPGAGATVVGGGRGDRTGEGPR